LPNICSEKFIKFQQNTGIIQLSENADKFYLKWLGNLEYINTTMRSIRKVQVDCTLLDLCANNADVMEKEYDGYVFDKILRNDGLFQFMVFLPELKLSSRITLRDNIDNYENKKFKLFLFNDEESFKKTFKSSLRPDPKHKTDRNDWDISTRLQETCTEINPFLKRRFKFLSHLFMPLEYFANICHSMQSQ
jgi:hypothetical protein